jgi:hypothetical protein
MSLKVQVESRITRMAAPMIVEDPVWKMDPPEPTAMGDDWTLVKPTQELR